MAPELFYLDCTAPEPHRLACYRWGNANAKATVLCAHGLSRNSRDFDFLAEALVKQGYQVIAADMPGRGKSSNLQNIDYYNNLVYTQDVKALLDHLGLEKVHWVGTSMGGAMAMLMEAQHPGTIQSLVLNDIGCALPLSGLAPIAAYLGSQRPTDKEGLQLWLVKNWGDFDVPGAAKDKYWQHLFTHYVQQKENGEWALPYDPNIVAAFNKVVSATPEQADFSALCAALAKVPTLLIRGGKSTLLTDEIAARTRALWDKSTPFEEYVQPNAGHAPSLMREEEIEKITGWINSRQVHAATIGGLQARTPASPHR